MKTFRALRVAAILFVTGLTACGGGGQSNSAAFLPAQQTSGATDGSTSVLASSGPALTVSGNVVAMISGGFQVQGGTGLGYFDIYTTSATVFSGTKPFVGEAVVVGGSGSSATTMTATAVAQGAPLTVSGAIVALKSNGFQINGGQGIGYLNVVTNAGTKISGAAPYVGETVKAVGVGSVSTSLNAVYVAQSGVASPAPSASPTSAPTSLPVAIVPSVPTVAPTAAPTATPAPTAAPSSMTQPATTAFMPSSWGKISAMQVFDDTANGYISQANASTNGHRYVSVWGARNNIGTSWLDSNPSLQTGYYNALETDESSTGWGQIGHTLTWWQTNHPDWILYACTSAGAATTTPAWVPGLNTNVPLDIHNPAVVDYQIRMMAAYAHKLGYHALAIDEATFWQADAGAGSGSYGCGIRQNGTWVQRYTGITDHNWALDVVAWVKQAHALLTTDPTLSQYHLKLIVNHPANQLTADEETFLANVDADLNEDGYTFFGTYVKGSAAYFTRTTDWTKYAQQHGVAVLTDDNWGGVTVGTPQIDWSVATYLMANEQAEALYAAQGNQFGTETWHDQYNTNVGAPCGEYYSAGDGSNPSIYYRRFANAIVVVNGGSGANKEIAHLPAGHTYTDLFGRPVSNPLTISSNDGYVLLTSNGCN
ncbi:MAG TPA: hypothetical protein VFL13_08870 [Candidatus Baltobacteraceae bacterium]|nr:hypothetical protein [Candidatus Baltobacteraceae bacterium]